MYLAMGELRTDGCWIGPLTACAAALCRVAAAVAAGCCSYAAGNGLLAAATCDFAAEEKPQRVATPGENQAPQTAKRRATIDDSAIIFGPFESRIADDVP